MKPNHLLPISVLSAITNTQTAMNQKVPITSETFDPFQGEKAEAKNNRKKAVSDPLPPKGTPSQVPSLMAATEPADDASQAAHMPLGEPAKVFRREPAAGPQRSAFGTWNPAELRRAVVLSEIIGPPLSRRGR
ncbi:MAG: hypothetical protein PUA86_05485 [Clostridiaceae bacterium]|nr:hypothetical protein [Clostridiaceae bacterium]